MTFTKAILFLFSARHRRLQLVRQEIVFRMRNPAPTDESDEQSVSLNSSTSTDDFDLSVAVFKALSLEQLLVKLHQLLTQCQCLGDQKMRLTAQVMETLSNKARQLVNWSGDSKANGSFKCYIFFPNNASVRHQLLCHMEVK